MPIFFVSSSSILKDVNLLDFRMDGQYDEIVEDFLDIDNNPTNVYAHPKFQDPGSNNIGPSRGLNANFQKRIIMGWQSVAKGEPYACTSDCLVRPTEPFCTEIPGACMW